MARSDGVDDRLVQSVTRAFDVLFAIAQSSEAPSVAELAKELTLPRPTVHRILNTMTAAGVVCRLDVNKGYVVTPKLASVTAKSSAQATLDSIAAPYLHRLVALGEETASLHIRTGDLRMCVAEVQGSRGIRWVRGPGWSAPIWSGAVGRALLAGSNDQELGEILARRKPLRLARNAPSDPDEIRRLIAADRERGWTTSESETVDGAAAVAVPIVSNGRTIAAVSFYGPADRLSHMLSLVEDLKNVAQELSRHWVAISSVHHHSVAVGDDAT